MDFFQPHLQNRWLLRSSALRLQTEKQFLRQSLHSRMLLRSTLLRLQIATQPLVILSDSKFSMFSSPLFIMSSPLFIIFCSISAFTGSKCDLVFLICLLAVFLILAIRFSSALSSAKDLFASYLTYGSDSSDLFSSLLSFSSDLFSFSAVLLSCVTEIRKLLIETRK